MAAKNAGSDDDATVPIPGPNHHAERLTGLRGIAVLLVMLYHQGITLSPFMLPNAYGDFGLSLFHRIFFLIPSMVGWSGIYLFFCLSGFLITGILIESRDSPRFFRTFYIRRSLRILPIYYVYLTFFIFIAPRLPGFEGIGFYPGHEISALWYYFHLSNVIQVYTGAFHHLALSVTWTLAAEEQFYLVWPWVLKRFAPHSFERFCWALVALAMLCRVGMLLADYSLVQVYLFPLSQFDGFALGALIAIYCRRSGGQARLLRSARWVLPVSLSLAGAMIAYLYVVHPAQPTYWYFLMHPVTRSIGMPLVNAGYAALFVLVAFDPGRNAVGRLMETRPLLLFGKYSYAIYLVHFPVMSLLATHVFHPAVASGQLGVRIAHPMLGFAFACFISFTACLALGWATWQLVEQPILRLKRRYPY